jgi:hypothetical protein
MLDDRAQSLAEFALVIPVLVILAFGIIDFGMGLRAYITVAQASREGARFASVGNDPGTFVGGGSGECNGSTTSTAVGKVCATLDGLGLSNLESVAVTYPSGKASGKSVHVRVRYQYRYITPIRSLVAAFSGGALSDHITITSDTDMRLE